MGRNLGQFARNGRFLIATLKFFTKKVIVEKNFYAVKTFSQKAVALFSLGFLFTEYF
jgi:hypothetical protein